MLIGFGRGKGRRSFASQTGMWQRGLAIVIIFLIILGLFGCGKKKVIQYSILRSPRTSGGTPAPVSQSSTGITTFPTGITLGEALAELRKLKKPDGVESDLFAQVKAELENGLRAKDLVAEKVTAQVEAGVTLSGSQGRLTWNEFREGDYNNDGIVKADDLIPIAIHFGKSDDPASPDHYKYAEYIDGDGDGEIGIGDVAGIAAHFGKSTIGYNIYEALDQTGLSSSKVATVLRPSPPQDPDNPPWNISFATLEYDTSSGTSLPSSLRQVAGGSRTAPTKDSYPVGTTYYQSGKGSYYQYGKGSYYQSGGERVRSLSDTEASLGVERLPLPLPLTIPPGWSPTSGRFYSVVSYGQGFDEQGAPIFVERFNLASNWVYINIPPVAIFKADPSSGEAPVTVTFDARDSYDADGYITNYLWDFDGDGLTDTVTQTPITTYEFTAPSINPASLLVYDNTGTSSPKLSLPLYIAGWVVEDISPSINDNYAGPLRAVVGPNGTVSLVFIQYIRNKARYDLRMARKKQGGDWNFQTILEGVSKDPQPESHWSYDVTDLPGGEVIISYYDAVGGALVLYQEEPRFSYFWKDAVEWNGKVGDYNAVAVKADGTILISYCDKTQGALKLAKGTLGSWSIEVVDNTIPAWTDIALSGDRIGISYHSFTDDNLLFAEYDGVGWVKEEVNSSLGGGGKYTAVAYKPDLTQAIGYYAADSLELRFEVAERSEIGWEKAILAEGISGRGDATLLYDEDGTGYLTFSWGGLPTLWIDSGLGWAGKTVDPMAISGEKTTVVLLADGNPEVFYSTNREVTRSTYRDTLNVARYVRP